MKSNELNMRTFSKINDVLPPGMPSKPIKMLALGLHQQKTPPVLINEEISKMVNDIVQQKGYSSAERTYYKRKHLGQEFTNQEMIEICTC